MITHEQGCNNYTSLLAIFELTTVLVKDTDCIGSSKYNYHTITTTTIPHIDWSINQVLVIKGVT
jgi:hypothetical protein